MGIQSVKQVEYHLWYLPPKPWAGPHAKPYLSSWKMSAKEAEAIGAIRPEPSSLEVREVPESEAEAEQQRKQTDTSAWSGKPR